MHKTGMPIGAICISPALVALALKDANIEVTLGEESGAAEQIRRMGHKHIAKKPNEIQVDRANKIVSTPAYMYDDDRFNDLRVVNMRSLAASSALVRRGNPYPDQDGATSITEKTIPSDCAQSGKAV